MDGQAEWATINTRMADMLKVVTNPRTNRVRRNFTLLMQPTPLPLRHTRHKLRPSKHITKLL